MLPQDMAAVHANTTPIFEADLPEFGDNVPWRTWDVHVVVYVLSAEFAGCRSSVHCFKHLGGGFCHPWPGGPQDWGEVDQLVCYPPHFNLLVLYPGSRLLSLCHA